MGGLCIDFFLFGPILKLEVTKKLNREQKEIWKQAIRYDYKTFQDPLLRLQFEKISVLGIPALDEEDSVLVNKQMGYSGFNFLDFCFFYSI